MRSCCSSIPSCWAKGSVSFRTQPLHANLRSPVRKLRPPASSSAPTRLPELSGLVPSATRRGELAPRLGEERIEAALMSPQKLFENCGSGLFQIRKPQAKRQPQPFAVSPPQAPKRPDEYLSRSQAAQTRPPEASAFCLSCQRYGGQAGSIAELTA
jgi:hypothetical protein